jgi:hypothetical protein
LPLNSAPDKEHRLLPGKEHGYLSAGDVPVVYIISEIAKHIAPYVRIAKEDERFERPRVHDTAYGLMSPLPFYITKRHTIHLLFQGTGSWAIEYKKNGLFCQTRKPEITRV